MGDRQNTAGYPAIAAPRRALPKLPRRQLQTPHLDRTTHDPLLRSGLQNSESQVAPMGAPKRAESQEFRRLVLKLAEALGLEPGGYEIRSNAGGIAVSG